MKLRRVIALPSLAIAAAFACAAPASAAPPHPPVSPKTATSSTGHHDTMRPLGGEDFCHGNQGGKTTDGGAAACFKPLGEHINVCDTKADGHHPGVYYSISGGAWHEKDYDIGNGACADLNLSIDDETGFIEFYPANFEGSSPVSYGDTYDASAQG